MRLKLVRDLKDKAIADTTATFIRGADPGPFYTAKLLEEAGELDYAVRALSRKEVIDEVADVIEVAYAIAVYCGISRNEVKSAVTDKRTKLGGYERGLLYQEY